MVHGGLAPRPAGGILVTVRRLAVVASLLAAAPAYAKPRAAPTPAVEEKTDFWRNIVEPHGEEIRHILMLARTALQQGDMALYGDYDPTGKQRLAYYRSAYGMLRYAHHRAPENLDVLQLLGQTADELGQTHEALEAFEAAVKLAGADKAGIEVTGRLGAIYLRLGRIDDAIHILRIAQGPIQLGKPISAAALVHLSNALAAEGDMGEAIDVLATAVPANVPYLANEYALVSFALAVLYDRDEQRGAAFDVIDHMQTQLTSSLGTTVQNALGNMRFAPAEDQHYYQGLLYEVLGNYTEARAEWALYAASGDVPYRARALEHIAAIDAQDRAPAQQATQPRMRVRRPIP